MVALRINLKGLEMDVAGAAGVAALALAGYFLLLHRPLQDVLAGHELQAQQDAAAEGLNSLQGDYRKKFEQLQRSRNQLQKRAEWLVYPDPPSEVLSRINDLARQCGVRIVRWQPQGTQSCSDYRVQLFSLQGAARWPALLRWLALIEQGVPLLDVTHYVIGGSVTAGQEECEFSCSLKLYVGTEPGTLQIAVTEP